MKATANMLEQAVAFFERYAQTFDERNWPAFISLYNELALSVRGDGTVKLFPSQSDALAFFQQVSDAWRGEGYSRFATSGLEVNPLGTRSMLVTLTWHMQRADGSLIKEWQQSYQLLLVGREWRVLASTFHAS